MAELADDLARWLFERLRIRHEPLVDVEALASRMGIDAIEDIKMIEDGRLEQDGRTATIYLRAGLPDRRRRFTVAHELGHRLLLHPSAPADRYRRRLAGDAEERFCDDLAAAILLPHDWVATNFAAEPRKLRTIRRLAASTGTSLSASLVRLNEVNHWTEALLRFRLVDERWRLDAPAGVPFELHRQLRTTSATSEVLTETGRRTQRDTRLELPIRIGGNEQRLQAEVSVTRSVAIALVDFSASVPIADANRTPAR
jgi:Zn-dependent peptidase ImmA (M78 family)